jgi:hypothetical protein
MKPEVSEEHIVYMLRVEEYEQERDSKPTLLSFVLVYICVKRDVQFVYLQLV